MELKDKIARALQRENARYYGENGIEASYESLAEAVIDALREQAPAATYIGNSAVLLERFVDAMDNNGNTPVSTASLMLLRCIADKARALLEERRIAPASVPDQAAIEAIAHRTCTKYLHGERPEYTFLPHTLMDFVQRLALPAPAERAVPEGWQLVPTAESRHRGIYKMLAELHIADRTPGLSEWDSYRAMLAAAPKPECSACGGRGMINPVNSGDPQDEVYCPDCAGPKPDNFERAGAIISTWPKWKQDYRLVPGAAPKPEGK